MGCVSPNIQRYRPVCTLSSKYNVRLTFASFPLAVFAVAPLCVAGNVLIADHPSNCSGPRLMLI